MNYNEKLKGFNSTEKYNNELEFLWSLFGEDFNKVLDYGCGNCYAMNKFNKRKNAFNGYDVNMWGEQHSNSDKLGQYDIVYFMHSLAHIENIEEVLQNLNTDMICIITPNKKWLNLQSTEGYIPDPTVIKHYSENELRKLIEITGYRLDLIGQLGATTENQQERIFIKAFKTK